METVRINTTRFGEIEAPPERVISMEKPVLGFEGRRLFIIIEHNDMFPFVWLQSLEVADLAFLMVNPALFFPDYKVEINRKEVEDIQVTEESPTETYAIVTVPDDPSQMTINLQGPILINVDARRAKQLVLSQSSYSVRMPLLAPASGLTRSPASKEGDDEGQKVEFAEL